jgi:hypothetical protein
VRRAAGMAGRDSPILPPVLGAPNPETFMLRDQVLPHCVLLECVLHILVCRLHVVHASLHGA